MKNALCDLLGIEFPLVAFSHCRDVVAAVSRAGGFGVLGVVNRSPAEVEVELAWLDAHVQGKPYGLDVVFAENLATRGEAHVTYGTLQARIPEAHRAFAGKLAAQAGVAPPELEADAERPQPFDPENAREVLDVAFRHPIRLIANALGLAPPELIARAKAHGVAVAALVGSKEHAIRQVNAGVDVIVAQGTEAGGHCGEVSTLVLVPEVIRAVRPIRDVPVLAAGGIVSGRQMAAAMALGAAGAWTGSVWLTTPESEVSPVVRDKLLEASSRDAVRTRARTGKPCRQLRSAWTEAWERSPESPGPLPMPLMTLVSEPVLRAADRAAQAGNPRARDLVTHLVGQGVGLMDSVRPAGQVVQDFKQELLEAVEDMNGLLEA